MADVHDIQRAFLHDIYTGEHTCAEYFAKDLWGGLNRFEIYRNNTFLGLTELLKTTYDVTRQIVGEAFFTQMARKYTAYHPQRDGNRSLFGSDFPEFLRTQEPEHRLAYLADVAALEWAQAQAGCAEDAPVLSIEAFSQLSMENAPVLALHPSVHLVPQTFNGLEIWKAHSMGTWEGTLEVREAPHALLVFRDPVEYLVFIKVISPHFSCFLEGCRGGMPFFKALQNAISGKNGLEAGSLEEIQREFSKALAWGVFRSIKG